MKTLEQFIVEKAPPGKKAEEWIKSNKAEFKKEYGDKWEERLYATAWKLFGECLEEVECFCEDLPASTTTDGVANPDAPMMKIKRDSFLGHPCYEVDDDTYSKCMKGKQPFKRWASYIQDEELRS